MRLSAALALTIAAPCAFAAAPASASIFHAADAARSAAELAKLVHPVELAVATAAEGSDRYLVSSMLKEPDFAELEQQYPGIMKAMYQAGRPFMLQLERRNALRIQQELAAIYETELSAGDIDAVHSFFSSGTGQKIIRGMFNADGVKELAEGAARNPHADVEAETLSRIHMRAAERMAATVTAEDKEISAAFMGSAVGVKMQKLMPRVQAMITKVVNERHSDLQEQIDSAMETAATRFVAAAKE